MWGSEEGVAHEALGEEGRILRLLIGSEGWLLFFWEIGALEMQWWSFEV